jgi:hypothetical protein
VGRFLYIVSSSIVNNARFLGGSEGPHAVTLPHFFSSATMSKAGCTLSFRERDIFA